MTAKGVKCLRIPDMIKQCNSSGRLVLFFLGQLIDFTPGNFSEKGTDMNRRFSKDGKPRCTVCRHPNKDKIDAYLLSGASPGYVERKFEGLKIGAIRRHKKLHLETVLPSRLDPPDISECSTNSLKMGDIAGQVRQLYQKAREDMDLAKETGDIPTSLKGNAQALKCLEVYFKASEAAFKLQKDSPGNTNLSKLRTVITKALKDHPEARKEVAKALIKSNLS